jgi:diacylglycerol kinase family enzyme
MSIEIIATSISGSIRDWRKVERIEPLFRRWGRTDASLHVVDSHAEARFLARRLVAGGARTVISAGGSGTFNAVLEGCVDARVGLSQIRLGFLRKGSADLIGKVLGMPDEIDEAVQVFIDSLAKQKTVWCDVLQARGGEESDPPRHFVGYGGAEVFGRIPSYTENRFIKVYKGVLGQILGDLGPFFVGAVLATAERVVRTTLRRGREWRIGVDGKEAGRGRYQALILVNGDLGPDLPFARGVPLGSGDFHAFGLRDLGPLRIPGQFRRAWNASILAEPERWGFEPYRITRSLRLEPDGENAFPLNVDGSTMVCRHWAEVRIMDRIRLISRR